MAPSLMDRKGEPNGILRMLASADERAWLLLGNIAELMGDDDHTVVSYEKVLRHNPHNIKALNAMGLHYRKRDSYSKGADCFQRILNSNNEHGEAWANLGYCYLMMNDLSNAYSSYQHALYHIPNPKDPNLWYGIGMLYDRYGSYEHAEEAFEAVLKMDAKFEIAQEVKFRLAVIAKQKGRYDEALDRLHRIRDEAHSRNFASDVWSQIGHIFELKGQMQMAKSAYQNVVDSNPNNAKALQQLGWLCLKAQNENGPAIDYLKKAVQADPKDGKGWYLLGRCYIVVSQFEEAYHAYKQAVNCDPGNPNVWCSLGVLFYQLNQYLDALDAYSRAINLNPNICEVWYNVGTLYDTCNQTSDARDAYQKAAELGADSQFIHERLNHLQAKESGAPPMSGMGSAPPPCPSEPPTSAPMSSVGGQHKSSGQYSGSAPAPLMPSPATSSSAPGPMSTSGPSSSQVMGAPQMSDTMGRQMPPSSGTMSRAMGMMPPGAPGMRSQMGPPGGMGPGPSGRMGPGPDSRMASDARMRPGPDARLAPDSRMGPGPDGRLAPDSRMGPGPDGRMSSDSRMGLGPDGRMSSDRGLGSGPDVRMGGMVSGPMGQMGQGPPGRGSMGQLGPMTSMPPMGGGTRGPLTSMGGLKPEMRYADDRRDGGTFPPNRLASIDPTREAQRSGLMPPGHGGPSRGASGGRMKMSPTMTDGSIPSRR